MRKKVLIFILILICLLVLIAFRSSSQNGVRSEHGRGNGSPAETTISAPGSAEKNKILPFSSSADECNTPVQRMPGEPIPAEVTQAALYGAKAKITLHVVDAKGNDVVGAEVMGSFAGTKNPAELYKVLTGADGRVTLDAVHAGYMVTFTVSKDKYYITRMGHQFDRRDWICVRNGCWIPWNPTLEVILKEKRNPIPMFAKWVKVYLPKKNTPFGFDCQVGDLVEPYGIGKVTDMVFTYSSCLAGEADRRYTNQLVIAALSTSEGIKKMNMDSWSELYSVHDAPQDGYQPEIVFNCKSESPSVRKEINFSSDMYLVFQSRIKKDKNGNILSVNCGKIYPMRFDYGEAPSDKGQGRVEFSYYFNPTPNDRNLEFDGKNNLMQGLSSLEEVYTP